MTTIYLLKDSLKGLLYHNAYYLQTNLQENKILRYWINYMHLLRLWKNQIVNNKRN